MTKFVSTRVVLLVASIVTTILSPISIGAVERQTTDIETQPIVVQNLFEAAKKNSNWKLAFATGKHEQIVFMNISPLTNPKNEIGEEVHPFDQVILIIEGEGQIILNGKTSFVKSGDMILIPEGTTHNLVNLSSEKALKIISFYSDLDLPKNAVYKTQADQPKE